MEALRLLDDDVDMPEVGVSGLDTIGDRCGDEGREEDGVLEEDVEIDFFNGVRND